MLEWLSRRPWSTSREVADALDMTLEQAQASTRYHAAIGTLQRVQRASLWLYAPADCTVPPPPDRHEQIAEAARAHPVSRVARDFGLSEAGTRQIVRRLQGVTSTGGRAAEVVRLLRERPELTHDEIAERVGLSAPRVCIIARENGFKRGRGRWRGDRSKRDAEIAALLREDPDLTQADIAEWYGLSRSRVAAIARAHSITRASDHHPPEDTRP